MSRENLPSRQSGNYDESSFGTKQKQWNYSDQSINIQQNRRCCSPAEEIEAMGEEDRKYSGHNVEVQTEKSTLFHLKQEKKVDQLKKNFVPNTSNRDYQDTRKIYSSPSYGHDKIAERLANVNMPHVYDDYAEADSEQPMDYTLCYNENNIEEEKKRSTFYINKTDFPGVEKQTEKEKLEASKSKGAYSKETKNKKEMFSNTSRSFKEIFNFFKDRDKKRSIDQPKVPAPVVPKFVKPLETYAFKEKPQNPTQSPVDQPEKEVKLKNEAQYSEAQQTPMMFSRCSSLSSLSGYEQISIHDDRSSIVSDFSRTNSGVISPSELPDSPAQSIPSGIRAQQKPAVNCQGIKKTLFPQQQDKFKAGQCSEATNDNLPFQNEDYYKKPTIVKSSVFEDDITPFKDESTPVLHSMAASSLSSLTIDDDDDYDLINKIIINREKQTVSEEDTDDSSRKDPIGESSVPENSSTKPEILLSASSQEENFNEELAPFEEQLLDQCVRTGIAKWTKQNVNEIKPFSWDVGLICRSTRVMLTNTILEEPETDAQIDSSQIDNDNKISNGISHQVEPNFYEETKKQNGDNYSSKSSEPTEPVSNFNEENDLFYGNSNNTTYEEHLLDQCIRRGISKRTRTNINSIRPFSWDVNQICLTTRAMMLRNRDDINFKGH